MNSEGMKGLLREIPDIKESELNKMEQVADRCEKGNYIRYIFQVVLSLYLNILFRFYSYCIFNFSVKLGEDRCENAVLIYNCINTEADEVRLITSNI